VQDAHDVGSLDYKGPKEINMSERIYMLSCLLLEELSVLTLDDDLRRIILSCRLIETMPEGFVDDRMQ
jgi:hypothetical protein